MDITFRPHHFLCALCFQGRGYSPAFIANFQAIMDHLLSPLGDTATITVSSHTDSICQPCPNRIGQHCTTEEKITTLDEAHAKALAIQAGDKMTWKDAKDTIQKKMTLDSFHQICATCCWKNLGICEKVLTEFLQKKNC